jgi:hypothetical protein
MERYLMMSTGFLNILEPAVSPIYFSAGFGDTCNNLQISSTYIFRDTIIRYHTSANLLHFAMDQMVLLIKDILCFKDISVKGAEHRYLI